MKTEDLLGVIDGGGGLLNIDRYKPVSITIRGLALASMTHKTTFNHTDRQAKVYDTAGSQLELTLTSSGTTTETRALS